MDCRFISTACFFNKVVFSEKDRKKALAMSNRCIFIFLIFALVSMVEPINSLGQAKAGMVGSINESNAKQRDGQHDFDFEIGTWKTQLKRLINPLSDGADTWVEYEGVTRVTKVWNGKANLVELVADGPAGHFEGLNLRLYNPHSRQWSLNFASIKSGVIGIPTIGEFKDGRGEFYSHETFNDRAILVRFVIADINHDSCRFEQAFSEDGGKTWEVNWVAIDTRIKDDPRGDH
jgi:hypothetical protein